MASYFGIFLYILTFICGFWLDASANRNNKRLHSIYVLWLYIFLCFGYMTGADWRSYEEEFYNWNSVFTKDYGYVYTINFFHYIIDDFWVIYDGFRCLYLWSVIKLLKKFTHYWLSALSFLMPMSLLSLTVDSPFRFMIALTFLNFAFVYILKSKYIPAVLCCIISVFFHLSVIMVIPLVFFLNKKIFANMNNWLLVLIYIVITVFTTSLDSINNVQSIIGLAFSDFGLNSYNSYEAKTSAIISFGWIIQSILFVFVLFTKSIVTRNTPNGSLVANMTILYFYIQRLGSAVPTGHRFGWLFTLFVAVYFVNLFYVKKFVGRLNGKVLFNKIIINNIHLFFITFVIYYGGSMTKTIVNHFAYIPYSNSIPYIIMGHKPYADRDKYNLDAYKQRTGDSYVLNSEK